MPDNQGEYRISKKRAHVIGTALVVALIVAPLTAIASHTFTDVSDANTFHADIDWLAGAGITKGCNPPTNDQFCPNDAVTRGQMAAFMKRFADYIDAADGTPAQADNANTLDNINSTGFVQKGEVDSVTAVMIDDEPGVTQGADNTGASLAGGAETLMSQAITVPGPGYVLAIASFEVFAVHAMGTTDRAWFGISDTNNAFILPSVEPNVTVPSGAPSGTYAFISSIQRILEVDSAGTHTFYFVGNEASGDVLFDDAMMSLVYLPSAYGAVATSLGDSGSEMSE